MWKWASWAAKLAATAVLVSFLSIWTTGYIVNSYVESLLKQFDLPLETKPFALSGVWGKLWGAEPVTEEAKESLAPAPSPSERTAVTTPSATTNEAAGGAGQEASTVDPASSEPEGDGAVPAMGGQASILDMSEQQREVLRSVMSKLNADQLSLLATYLDEGLTESELQDAGEMLKETVSDDEYAQIMALLQERAASPQTTSSPEQQDSAE